MTELGRYCLQNNLRLQAVRLQSEIESIQRRIDGVNMKLITEMKVPANTAVSVEHFLYIFCRDI